MYIRTLVVVDPATQRRRLARMLAGPGLDVKTLPARGSIWSELNRGDYDLIVIGRALAGTTVDETVASLRALPENPDVIVMVEREDPADRAALLASGCVAVLNLGLDDAPLHDTLRTLVARRRSDAVERLRGDRPEERYSLGDFVAASPAMQVFLEMPRRVAASDSSILILGETGVGKERLARAIHAESPRGKGPFLAVNCGALPESLLESELFGHEEGAFTGATRSRKGYFELAHRGTLFLDEIGEMPLHLQVKLLRVLEDRTVRRVGSEKTAQVDVRIMAASNRDLEAEVKVRHFRPDLYFRLAVVTLTVPPLRNRREDIPRLVEDYIARFRLQTNRRVRDIDPAALDALVAYDWPGNVRELINVIEQACLLCRTERLEPTDLPGRISGIARGRASTASVDDPSLLTGPLPEARRRWVDAFEQRYLENLLRESRGRIGETARRAGITERSLYDLMRRHGLRKEAFKGTANSEAAPPNRDRRTAARRRREPPRPRGS